MFDIGATYKVRMMAEDGEGTQLFPSVTVVEVDGTVVKVAFGNGDTLIINSASPAFISAERQPDA